MLLEELSKIAAQSGNCRLVISYNGDDKYALGVSDGVTTPLVVNGTLVELQTAVAEKLPGYLELAAKEAAEKEVKEEAVRHEAELKAVEARLKQEAAARKACCHDFIVRLPGGYDTMVGEGGCTLSGGEKQRLSIARAILKEAPIVLLDEATASLDPENEVEVQKAINTLIEGRTVIVIAHRLKTIRNADKIIVLREGAAAECGTHDELMRLNGKYAEMFRLQSKNYSLVAGGEKV